MNSGYHSEAEVRELIKAAQDAPSWANQQPTKYYVAISEEKPNHPERKNLDDVVKFF